METLTNFIAAAFVIHFVWSYYTKCYRKGYNMDLWHYFLGLQLLVVHIMLPFSRSDLNVFALGPALLRRTQEHVTEAYLISALGYAGVLLGGEMWRLRLGLGIRRRFSRLIELPTLGSLGLMRSKRMLTGNGVLAVLLMGGVLVYCFRITGFAFGAGNLVIQSPGLRPIAQFALFYSVLIASFAMVRVIRFREPSMMMICGFLTLGLLFYGSRSSIAYVFILCIQVGFIRMGKRVKLIHLAAGAAFAIFLTFFLDALRRPGFSMQAVLSGIALNFFYGNSFSDTRDFAIVLSFWHGQYFWGKTYLAALIAFIPRSLSTFRDTWALGVVTASMAGFSPLEHPGLRVGNFGEAFFNFGFPGVILLSLFIGAAVKLVDMRMKQTVRTLPKSNLRPYSYYIILTVVGVCENSTGAATLYTTMLILLVSALLPKLVAALEGPAF